MKKIIPAHNGFRVDCRNLIFAPPGQPDNKVLDNVRFSLEPGQIAAVIGYNGSGKSTLLKAISGEIKLSGGHVSVAGQRVNGPINRVIDGVGIVHQNDEDDLLHEYSILLNVAFRQVNNDCHPSRFFALSPRYKAKIGNVLDHHAKELDHDLRNLVGHLSAGQRQILNLAIAIYLEHEHNPCKLILLDEHTAKLDHERSKTVMDYTIDQIRSVNASALMVTHRYEDALLCDRIIVMSQGKIHQELECSESLTKEDLKHAVAAGSNNE